MSPDDTRPPDLVWPEHEEFNTRPNARGPRVRSFDPSALRTLRTNSQLTRDQLAEQIGTSVSSVKMWETGHRTPTARVADRIAEVLGVSPATLSGPEPVFDPAANTLRAVRLRAKLNAQDIADALGTRIETVYDVENGQRLPPDAVAWARAYGITQPQLMGAWALSYQQDQARTGHGEATAQG
ncbi:MAG TPA: helix-turn-helix domain-containing protein [Candidatus Limnocylindrales bacterium]|jgi:transcriptional regulator with XRE-family HTH domain|nr:helix-turn-helix domain-containing protein [Candidatus Limnocylindrales bacterium]